MKVRSSLVCSAHLRLPSKRYTGMAAPRVNCYLVPTH